MRCSEWSTPPTIPGGLSCVQGINLNPGEGSHRGCFDKRHPLCDLEKDIYIAYDEVAQ